MTKSIRLERIIKAYLLVSDRISMASLGAVPPSSCSILLNHIRLVKLNPVLLV